MVREAVIVEAVRTPVGRRKGLVSQIRPDELAALVLAELIRRAGIDANLVDDVIMGCVSQIGEQSMNIARNALLIAGFPKEIPGTTIDRQCGSSQQAVHFGAQAILSGDMEVVVAAGVESMTRVPLGSSLVGAETSPALRSKYTIISQGLSAELIADQWGFSREQLDAFSFASHQKAIAATRQGRFQREILPLEVNLPDGTTTVISKDEGPRPDTSLEKMAALQPAFKTDGKITAGNSSQISDGAAALLLMSLDRAQELGLQPRARVVARAVVGDDPTLMLTAPIPATKAVLKKAGMSIDDIDLYEVNEAFAPVPLAWLEEIGADPSKLNVNGGAIALGHPLGASGARLMTSLLYEMERSGARFGLQTMCEGGGMANATILERI